MSSYYEFSDQFFKESSNIDNQLDVWKLNISALSFPENKDLQNLNSDQEKHFKRFHFKKDKKRYFYTRFFLKKILSKYLQLEDPIIFINKSKFGKPYLQDNSIYFNISHSSDYIVWAFSKKSPIGIDVEYKKDKLSLEGIMKRYFHPKEVDYFQSLKKGKQVDFFYFLWTAKEAFLKSRGESLSHHLDLVFLNLEENKFSYNKKKYHIKTLAIDSAYASCLVMEGQNQDVNIINLLDDL